MKIHVNQFGGVAPRLDPRDLPDSGARVAMNIDTEASVLQPIRDIGAPVWPDMPGEPGTIYHYDNPALADLTWFSWPPDKDIHVVKGPLAGDEAGWVFFTGETENEDRLRGTYNPYYSLDDDSDSIEMLPTGSLRFFLPAPETPLTAEVYGYTPEQLTGLEVHEDRVYTYTRVYVSEFGYTVESPPAPVGSESWVEVPWNDALDVTASVELSGFTPYDGTNEPDFHSSANNIVAGGHGTYGYRFYRSVGGGYILINEVLYTDPDTPFIDTVATRDLTVTELPSLDWDNPPVGMRGLINLPGGVMAGFKGYDVFFSEPFIPHAWPLKYSLTVDYPIVGLGVMDTTLVILTEGSPYFAQGSHPDSMVLVRGQMTQACVSSRSIVSRDNAVYYASEDGLVALTSSGGSIVTAGLISPRQWREEYRPETIHAYWHRGKYVAFNEPYDTELLGHGFMFFPGTGRFAHHSFDGIVAGYTHPREGALYVARLDGNGVYGIMPWEEEIDWASEVEWSSKIWRLPFVSGFGWAQVESATYPVRIAFTVDDNPIMFADPASPGDVTDIYEVQSDAPFRLPAIVGREWAFYLVSVETRIYSVTLAQSSAELAAV